MNTYILLITDDERIDVPNAISLLQTLFPGALVTAPDTFEAERQRNAATMEQLIRMGVPIRNPEIVIQDITNKEKAMGPGVDVSVPVLDVIFDGTICAKSIKLHTDATVTPHVLEAVRNFLVSFRVGKIYV